MTLLAIDGPDHDRTSVARVRAEPEPAATWSHGGRSAPRQPFAAAAAAPRRASRSQPRTYSVGRVISAGTTQASNSSPVRSPDATAASRSVEPSWWADFAIFAALS